MLQQTCLRINRYPVDRNSTCYTTLRLVPTEIIVIVLVKELGKSVLFWIIRKVPTLVQYGNVKSETWIDSISVNYSAEIINGRRDDSHWFVIIIGSLISSPLS